MAQNLENLKDFISSGCWKDKKLTIALLGATGVGKTSFINTFANQLQYETFEEAISQRKVYVPVYTKFTHYNEEEEQEKDIVLGDPSDLYDVRRSAVESSTKHPCSYTIKNGKHFEITIIDTPGLGDTTNQSDSSGSDDDPDTGAACTTVAVYGAVDDAVVADDRVTVDDEITADDRIINAILNHLSVCHEVIHAFVVVMKPDETRKTKEQLYTIRKLLDQLHKSAKTNVVFAFTHAHNTNFRPGGSIQVLRETLQKMQLHINIERENRFYFENTFRYLAVCAKNCTNNMDQAAMVNHWQNTSNNFVKLLKHVRTLEPHNTKATISLQEVRMNIQIMTDPLLEICKSTRKTTSDIYAAMVKTNETVMKQDNTSKVITVKGEELVYKELEKPRTVCTNEKCSKKEKFPRDGTTVTKMKYDPICCENCWLPIIPIEKTGTFLLHFCGNLRWRTCKICRHHLREHMHVTYELEQFEKILKGNTTWFVKRYHELKDEYNKIVQACALFMYYLSENKLLKFQFQDSVTSDLKNAIKQEKLRGNDAEKVTMLTELKNCYKDEFKRLKGEQIPTEEDIKKRMLSLFKLTHNGKMLKTIYDGIKETHRKYHLKNARLRRVYTIEEDGDKNNDKVNPMPFYDFNQKVDAAEEEGDIEKAEEAISLDEAISTDEVISTDEAISTHETELTNSTGFVLDYFTRVWGKIK